MKFVREIGRILEGVEHEVRMVRTDAGHPDNNPFYFLNKVGQALTALADMAEEKRGLK